jgi:thioredoxin reductase (NADPH)
METKPENVVILGTGCAGLTAAVYAARANLSPLVIEGPQPGGQLTTTSEVENYPGFPDGIDGFALTDSMRRQAQRFGARFVSDQIGRVELGPQRKLLHGTAASYSTHALIIATGASSRWMGVPGEKDFFGGKGVTTCATCDGAFYRGMDVAVVGGGDSACEEALFLTRFCTKVYLIHRRDTLRASKIMADRVLKHPLIQPVWDTVVMAVDGDATGHVQGLSLKNTVTGQASQLACKGVFVAIGHIPNTKIFEGILPTDALGYLQAVPGNEVKTAIPGVFAAGDCVDHVYRQAITAAGSGCKAAIEAERWLAELSG